MKRDMGGCVMTLWPCCLGHELLGDEEENVVRSRETQGHRVFLIGRRRLLNYLTRTTANELIRRCGPKVRRGKVPFKSNLNLMLLWTWFFPVSHINAFCECFLVIWSEKQQIKVFSHPTYKVPVSMLWSGLTVMLPQLRIDFLIISPEYCR